MKNTTVLSQGHAKQLQLRNKLRLATRNNRSTSMVWPTLGSRTAKKNRKLICDDGFRYGFQTASFTFGFRFQLLYQITQPVVTSDRPTSRDSVW